MRTSRIAFLAAHLALAACGGATPSPEAPRDGRGADSGEHPAIAALDAASRDSLRSCRMRMYVLPERYAPRSTVMAEAAWCALSYRDDELNLSLHATRGIAAPEGATLAVPAPPTAAVRGEPAYESLEEGIRGLSWNEGDVSYLLEVECARPFEDRRCTEGAFLSELAEELVGVAEPSE